MKKKQNEAREKLNIESAMDDYNVINAKYGKQNVSVNYTDKNTLVFFVQFWDEKQEKMLTVGVDVKGIGDKAKVTGAIVNNF